MKATLIIISMLMVLTLACGAAAASQPVVTVTPDAIQEIIERSESLQKGIEPTPSRVLELEARVDELVERILDLELRNPREYADNLRDNQTWKTASECQEAVAEVVSRKNISTLTGAPFIDADNSIYVFQACEQQVFIQRYSPEVRAMIVHMAINARVKTSSKTAYKAMDDHLLRCHSGGSSFYCY